MDYGYRLFIVFGVSAVLAVIASVVYAVVATWPRSAPGLIVVATIAPVAAVWHWIER